MKTITLTNKNEQGEYILFSGEERKRKVGYLGVDATGLHFPYKREITPEVRIIEDRNCSVPFNLVEFYLKDKKGKIEEYIFKKKVKFCQEKEINLLNIIEGKNIIELYRTFKLIDNATKIPFKKFWEKCPSEYLLLGSSHEIEVKNFKPYTKISDIYQRYFEYKAEKNIRLDDTFEFKHNFWTALFADPVGLFEVIENPIVISYLKEISKQTKMSKKKIQKIDRLYPLDDNKEEIKESDLVNLILKD
jgi:hypothetical protein